jgi:hypothetical protein
VKLGKRLAVASIKRTADIKRARLGHGAGPPTAVQAGASAPPQTPLPALEMTRRTDLMRLPGPALPGTRHRTHR